MCDRKAEEQAGVPVHISANIRTSYDLSQAVHKSKQGNKSQRRWMQLKEDEAY